MKITTQLLFLLLTILLFTRCGDDEPTYDSSFGSIFVYVTSNGSRVDGANVVTNPSTGVYLTDASGAVIIKDVEPETYQINVFHPNIGVGVGAALVNSGRVTSVDISLSPGTVPNPFVTFVSPINGSVLDTNVDIVFSVVVTDADDNPENIALEWTSSLDGLLSTESASPNGNASITASNLSVGEHLIQVQAIDSDGFLGGASIAVTISDIPDSVVLDVLDGGATGIELNWSMTEEPGFSNYTVYRSVNSDSNFEIVEIVNDINTTTYFDNNVLVGESYYYRIGLTLSNQQERLSNIQFLVFEGVSIYIAGQVEKMIVDPNRPFIYAVDRVNNSLHFINTDVGELVKTIFVGSSPTDLDMSLDGEKLYVCNFGSNIINVIDLTTQENDFSFFVDTDVGTWDGNPYRIAVMSDNRLAFTSEDQHQTVSIVNATTGVNITTFGSVYQPDLFTDALGNVLYVAEHGTTGSQLLRYDINGTNTNEVDETNSASAWERTGFITTNGQYIFFNKKKILASNLQSSLGTFEDHVFAANADGSIVLGEAQYYNGETFAILGDLPVTSNVMASDPNEDLFYIYNSVTSSIVLFVP